MLREKLPAVNRQELHKVTDVELCCRLGGGPYYSEIVYSLRLRVIC